MSISSQEKERSVRSVYRPVSANRREFFRVIFQVPLKGSMQVVEIMGKKIEAGGAPVLIEDTGLGGLCFTSNINLPTHPELILQISFSLADEYFVFSGKLKRRQDENGLFTYGLEFMIKEEGRQELFVALTKLQVKMRNDLLAKGYDWYEGSKRDFF
ncbi:hypothetical protein CR205_04020 [Alteribacter lacisalsi]|uniref:PilZ domain-containing protein n=1 Tax=Alteribacter lacisalsi TaxID=2045244 RepID=A0A2W0HLM7_9BACI|nr:PilZ domain-containing protein [Alteribacter lacisalsi]PYZ97769.1 hypothetical protein CR205_04020 [Alteribacter lacisalsi]